MNDNQELPAYSETQALYLLVCELCELIAHEFGQARVNVEFVFDISHTPPVPCEWQISVTILRRMYQHHVIKAAQRVSSKSGLQWKRAHRGEITFFPLPLYRSPGRAS